MRCRRAANAARSLTRLHFGIFSSLLLLHAAASGCVATGGARELLQREIESAARPLLEMDPEANWTACFNRLLACGPAAGDYLAARPEMTSTAPPDSLRVMLHTSLLRLLITSPAAPRLSVNCFETTLNLLHFDPKVCGRPLGEIWLPAGGTPAAWHDLYPAQFNHELARRINVDADRRSMLRWWQTHRGEAATIMRNRPLVPLPSYLWTLLSRRRADVWFYEVKPGVRLCRSCLADTTLLRSKTLDYNIVRAACIWLASNRSPNLNAELIELVASSSSTVAYNARFALARSWDPAIRDVIERYEDSPLPDANAPQTVRRGARRNRNPFTITLTRASLTP